MKINSKAINQMINGKQLMFCHQSSMRELMIMLISIFYREIVCVFGNWCREWGNDDLGGRELRFDVFCL